MMPFDFHEYFRLFARSSRDAISPRRYATRGAPAASPTIAPVEAALPVAFERIAWRVSGSTE